MPFDLIGTYEDGREVPMRFEDIGLIKTDAGYVFRSVFTIDGKSYDVDTDVHTVNLEGAAARPHKERTAIYEHFGIVDFRIVEKSDAA